MDKRSKAKADKSRKTEWWCMKSIAEYNKQWATSTTVETSKIITTYTHLTSLTAQVENEKSQ